MADISKIQINGTTYSLKDEVARAAVSKLETAVSSSLVFKGIVANNDELEGIIWDVTASVGDTYKINSNFVNSQYGPLQNGDMFVCIGVMDWAILQNNIDVFTGATIEYSGTMGLVPSPEAGTSNRFLAVDGTWKTVSPEISWGSISDLT